MTVFWAFGTIEFIQSCSRPSPAIRAWSGLSPATFHLVDRLCPAVRGDGQAPSSSCTWLPDAMEGPTPVRPDPRRHHGDGGRLHGLPAPPMFEYAPVARSIVTVVGAVTALFAATVGLAQNDIKRVIAYSTCSQLGYMFFAAGVGLSGGHVPPLHARLLPGPAVPLEPAR